MPTPLEQAALDSTAIIPDTLDGGVPDLAKAVQNKGVWPRFEYRPILNKKESDKSGRPIHERVEWVTVIIAGDRNSQPSHKVSDIDRAKWPDEYAAFKNGKKMPVQGTPLNQWQQLGIDQVADLEALGILTVEMLADLSDEQVQSFGLGGMQLRELAIAYIKTSEDNAYPQHLAAEVDHLKKDNEFKDGQIEILKKKLDEVSDNPDSTERVEQLETMVTTLTSSNKTLQENNGLLKDKIETLGSGDSLLQNLVVDMKSDIEAAANELTDTRKLLADAEKSIVELTKPEKTKPKSKKTETAKSD